MHKQELAHLEGRIKDLSISLRELGSDEELSELLRLIPRPGWTTPAEFLLVSGIVDYMLESSKTLNTLKQNLLVGSREVATSLEKT